MAAASLGFALMNTIARRASRGVPWQEVAAVRAAFGALVALGMARARHSSLRLIDKRGAWMRTLYGTVALMATFYAISSPHLPIGDIITITATTPIFVALLSPALLGERVERRIWLATPLAFVGVAVVVQPAVGSASTIPPAALALAITAAAMALLAALFSAMAMIWLRRIGPSESNEAVVFQFSVVSMIVAAIASIPTFRLPSGRVALEMAVAGIMGGFAQIALTRAYSLDRAARLSAVGYLGTVFTQALAIPILGEQPVATQAIGAALVIAAGWILAASAWSEGRRAR